MPARERAARAAERRAAEAALGFGDDELPDAREASHKAGDVSEGQIRGQKRKFCQRQQCQCGLQHNDLPENGMVLAEEEDRLLQLAVSASLAECAVPESSAEGVTDFASLLHPCIELSDDE